MTSSPCLPITPPTKHSFLSLLSRLPTIHLVLTPVATASAVSVCTTWLPSRFFSRVCLILVVSRYIRGMNSFRACLCPVELVGSSRDSVPGTYDVPMSPPPVQLIIHHPRVSAKRRPDETYSKTGLQLCSKKASILRTCRQGSSLLATVHITTSSRCPSLDHSTNYYSSHHSDH